MKHLIAFTGSRSGGLHIILSTNDDIFSPQTLNHTVPYSPSTILDDGEWFIIDSYSTTGYSNDFIAKESPLNTIGLNQLPVDKFEKIKYMCSEDGHIKYFQKLSPSQIIHKKWFSISDAPILENNKKIISFSGIPDAIYDSASDRLYFKDISKVKPIFKGIDELYREATHEEVTDFLNQEFIELAEDYTSENVTIPNRKRIAIAVDRMRDYSPEQKREIFDYIHDYCPDVQFNNGRFLVSSEDDLKYILFGIDERYYTTRYSNEKRLANSVIAM